MFGNKSGLRSALSKDNIVEIEEFDAYTQVQISSCNKNNISFKSGSNNNNNNLTIFIQVSLFSNMHLLLSIKDLLHHLCLGPWYEGAWVPKVV